MSVDGLVLPRQGLPSYTISILVMVPVRVDGLVWPSTPT